MTHLLQRRDYLIQDIAVDKVKVTLVVWNRTANKILKISENNMKDVQYV